MNKKTLCLLIPTIILPYFVLIAPMIVVFSNKVPLFKFIIEKVFSDNALLFAGSLFVLGITAAILSTIFFIISLKNNYDELFLSKAIMKIKLFQIPAYILIFIFGALLFISLFTIPFSIFYFLFDCLTLFLTSMLNILPMIISIRKRIFSFKETVWLMIFQFIFCFDVVSSIVFYKKLKKKKEIIL